MNRRTIAILLGVGQTLFWIAVLVYLLALISKFASNAANDSIAIAILLAIGAGALAIFFGLQSVMLGIEAEVVSLNSENINLRWRYGRSGMFSVRRGNLWTRSLRVLNLSTPDAVQRYFLAWDQQSRRLFSVCAEDLQEKSQMG